MGTTLLWAPEGEAAYGSQDLGKTWTVATGWPATPDRGMEPVADPQSDAVFYAFDKTRNVILRSLDAGKHFDALPVSLPKLESYRNAQLRAVPGRTGDLWLAAPAGLLHVTANAISPAPDVTTAWQVTFGKAAPGHDFPTTPAGPGRGSTTTPTSSAPCGRSPAIHAPTAYSTSPRMAAASWSENRSESDSDFRMLCIRQARPRARAVARSPRGA